MIKFMLILPIRWRRYWSRFSFVDEPTANPNRISSKQILELFQAVFWDVGHGTTENSSEIHTGTFVLCAIAGARAQRREGWCQSQSSRLLRCCTSN